MTPTIFKLLSKVERYISGVTSELRDSEAPGDWSIRNMVESRRGLTRRTLSLSLMSNNNIIVDNFKS